MSTTRSVGKLALVCVALGLADVLATRCLVAWDGGTHLLAGTRSAATAVAILVPYFILHLGTRFVVPTVLMGVGTWLVLGQRRAHASSSGS